MLIRCPGIPSSGTLFLELGSIINRSVRYKRIRLEDARNSLPFRSNSISFSKIRVGSRQNKGERILSHYNFIRISKLSCWILLSCRCGDPLAVPQGAVAR